MQANSKPRPPANPSGARAQTFTYDSFGNTTRSSGTLADFFRYTGREFDTETSLYSYRARYLDSEPGRFLSEDPLEFNSDRPNLYLYVRNNPADLIDPLGLAPGEPIICIACIQFGAGALDMWNNYERMKQRNWTGDDKYYHCMANCQATDQGFGGAVAAKIISFFRTDVSSRILEPTDWRNDDKANKCGQQGGNCDKTCAPWVPKSSPGKPKFPGW